MKRVTIDDVARTAGVSRQTVSRAINGKRDISEETRERVLAVVRDLGFRPNRVAQSMITQRTYTVGVEVIDITNPVFAEIVRGTQDVAAEHGYNILLTNSNDDPDLALHSLSNLVTHGVDGLIAMFPNVGDSVIQAFADQYRPVVLINRTVEHPHINTITIDIYQGAVLAVEHLLECGHTRIGMVANHIHIHSSKRRVTAYQDTLQKHHMDVSPHRIVYDTPTLRGGYRATRKLLQQIPTVTAIFGYNDLMAMGAMRACHDMGYRVPQDCAVIGFDNLPLTEIVTPSLSTIHYDKYALGQAAMRRVLAMMQPAEPLTPVLELPVRLIPRESTARG
jgi:LacI family transcriptional regulator